MDFEFVRQYATVISYTTFSKQRIMEGNVSQFAHENMKTPCKIHSIYDLIS